MEAFEPYPSLVLALVSGLLIGLEREQSRPGDGDSAFLGGIRTYPLIALTGAVAVLLGPVVAPWAVAAGAVAIGALVMVGYWSDSKEGHFGLTSEVSALLTFFMGALAASSQVLSLERRLFVVSSIAVVATVLLSQKTQLRALTDKISKDDVIATLKFLMVAVVVLPMLPNAPYGPYGALNPFRIGMMVVLIAGIGFVGYVAMRLWGHGRGMLVVGAVGGLASSTAVTLAASARAKETPEIGRQAALAVIIASTIMGVRVVLAAFIVEPSLLRHLMPMGAMIGVGAAMSFGWYFFARRQDQNRETADIKLSNPFELSSAIKFGALFAVIMLISRWAFETFGTQGTYITGVLGGLTDVDAITLSMSNLVKNQAIDANTAGRTIVLAAVSNTVVKGALALFIGGGQFGRRVALALGAMLPVTIVLAFVL